MRITHQLTLGRDEWNSFETELNRYDPVREERAAAFLMGEGANRHRSESGESTVIDVPGLTEDEIFKLLGISQDKKSEVAVFQYGSEVEAMVYHGPEEWQQEKTNESWKAFLKHSDYRRNEFFRQKEESSLKCA